MGRTEVEQHYRAQWGSPDFSEEFSAEPLQFVLYRWDESPRTRGVTIYATFGMSAHRDSHSAGAEVLVGISPACDDICTSMADLSATVVERGIDVAHGATWRMGGPLWPGTELSFYLTLHQHSTIDPLVQSGEHVEFFQAIPIFEYEAELKKRHGLDALKQRWKQDHVQFWDPTRLPMRAD